MKILVLDDAKVIRSLLKLTLETKSYEVTTSATTEEAFQVALVEVFDLIIVDYMLDEQKIGLELIEKLLNNNPEFHTPCIVLSAEQMKEHRNEAKDLGIKAWVKKPFTPVGILETVARILEKPETTCN